MRFGVDRGRRRTENIDKCNKFGHTRRFCPGELYDFAFTLHSRYVFNADGICGLKMDEGVRILDTGATHSTTPYRGECKEDSIVPCTSENRLATITNGGQVRTMQS